MKHLFLRRFLPALLCLVFAMSLTACGGKEDNTTKDGDEGTKGMISGGKGGKGGKGNVSASKVDPKQAAESLALLQGGLIYSDQTTGAVTTGCSKIAETLHLRCRSCWTFRRSVSSARATATSTASCRAMRIPALP